MNRLKKIFDTLCVSGKFWFCAIFIITFAAFAPSLCFNEMSGSDLFSFSFCGKSLIRVKEHIPAVARFINILLHCGSALLFFFLLRSLKWGEEKLSPAWAGMAALIFSLHPQRVESVVQLSECKDCLAMFLGIAALLCFVRAMRKDKISWAGALLLLLSCLTEPMWFCFIVPAAAVIWCERRCFQWKLYLKLLLLPFLLFVLFSGLFIYDAFTVSSEPGMTQPFLFNMETLLYNWGNYFVRTFLPGNLFPLYPCYDPGHDPRWMMLVPVGLCFIPFLAREKSFRPAIIYGILPLLFCFAAAVLPVPGIIPCGAPFFADRYSYLPALFLITGAAFLLKLNLPLTSSFGRWLPVLGVLYCGGMFCKTAEYLPVWKTQKSMIERSLAPQMPHFCAAVNAVIFHLDKAEYEKALEISEKKLHESSCYPEKVNSFIKEFKSCLNDLIIIHRGKKLTASDPLPSQRYANAVKRIEAVTSRLPFKLPRELPVLKEQKK